MLNIFEAITKRLIEAWKSDEPSGRRTSFRCRCGRPIYFRNSLCLGCQAALGFEPQQQEVRSLTPGAEADTWMIDGQVDTAKAWKRCENFETPAGCNWLVPADDVEALCRSCRLNRTIPDLEKLENHLR